jgi:RNA polymerase sigma-32 factor
MNSLIQNGYLTDGNLFQYISKVNKIPMLSDEDELFHAKEKDRGSLDSAKILVSSHLRLVVKIASRYRNYGLPMMDLISEGNIGLIRAVKTFDYAKGYKFATYAIWWIKSFIHEYILKSWSIVKIGTSVAQRKLFFNLRKIKNNILSYTHRRNLNNDEIKSISDTLCVSTQDVIEMDCRAKGDIYLNKKIKSDEEEDTEIIDLIPAKQPLQDVLLDNKREHIYNIKLLKESLGVLDERELKIIKLRKLSDNQLTLSEVGEICDISGERVRQIEVKAIEKMRVYMAKKS